MNPFAPLAERVRGTVVLDAPLAPLTTYRIGGPARALVEPADAEDVAAALAAAQAADRPWMAIGLGSNLLVRDGGFDGLVLRLGRSLGGLEDLGGGRWRAGAGLPTPLLARRTAAAGFGGVHRLAGAHGQEFKDTVRRVVLVEQDGRTAERQGREIDWVYRSSQLGAVVVLETELALAEDDPSRLDAEIREHFRWRKAGTPFQEPCCGSVFRNPVGRQDGRTAERQAA